MPTWLPHVDYISRQKLQQRLEVNGQLSVNFLALLAASTIIATLGLFQSSPAVIIGAMIIAPLMRPLVCLSLATITADAKLLYKGLFTLLIGTVIGVIIASAMAMFLRSLEMTPEIVARTRPTLLDLAVALAAGAVGAYCQADEKLADTLAGVAIAVALVPPLSVVGIGIAFGDITVSFGAALLYATNLVGITTAGAIVFLIKGFSPLKVARTGLVVSSGFFLLLTIPLALSMRELILENQVSAKVRNLLKEKTVTFRDMQLREVQVKRFRTPMAVHATVYGSNTQITSHQVKLVQDLLVREIGIPIEFSLRIVPATELGALEVTPAGQERISAPIRDQEIILQQRPTSETEKSQNAASGQP